ncbi:MAG: ABC transporter substrate-binding protein [Nitrospirae bacterium]|nr:ABC transporter substrate-binding protein [Nitrospirota bacterium]
MKGFPKNALVVLFLGMLFFASKGDAATIGIILTSDVPYYNEIHDALISRLVKRGYSERLKFIVQKPYPDPVAWSNAARKLIAADVDIIVTYGCGATFATLRERPDVPVVYAGVYEPVLSKQRAKNLTGVTYNLPVSSILRYLRTTTSIKTLGVLYSSMEEDSLHQLEEIKALSPKYGFSVTGLNLKKTADITVVLSESKTDAIFLTSSSLVNAALPTILNITRNKKIPTGSLLTCGEICALITLTADPKEQGSEASDKLIEILNGKSPRDIPVSHSKNTELIFNMKNANDIGIKIPIELVTEATKILY